MSTETLPKSVRAGTDGLDAQLIDSRHAMEELRGEWQALWSRSGARPFQSLAWQLPWLRHVASREPAGLAVRDATDGSLVALAPLYVYRDPQGVRHLFPLGIATTDYLDVLCETGRDDALAAVAEFIASQRGWDVFEAPQLAAGSLLLRCRWPQGSRHDVSACEPNPVVSLDAPLPCSFAKRLRGAQRRIARAGRVEYEGADRDGTPALLDELARLHASRWSTRGEPGVLAGAGVMQWHRESAEQLAGSGLLRLVALKFDGRVIGVVYALADAPQLPRRRWYSYIGGFDPAFDAFSPGTLLIAHAIDAARAEGAAHFDFLRGAEPYKYRWGAVDQPMFALRVTR